MAFSELELKRIDRTVGDLCRRRSPSQFADKLSYHYEIEGHRVTIFEDRPYWRDPSAPWTHHGIARFRFVRKTGVWTLYWKRADMRWHLYEPEAMPADLGSLVALVEEDRYGAFFG